MKLGWIAALALLASACGGTDEAKDEDAVRDAAQEQADRYTSGDFAGAWDMWVDSAKGVMGQADYVTYAEACAGTGVPIKVDSARIDGDGEATVRLGIGDFAASYRMEYEDGDWSWVPNDDSLAMYALGADGAIAKARAEGSCVGS